MKTGRIVANVTRNDLAMMRTEPGVYAVLFLMPILLIGFLRPLFGVALRAEGYEGATGAELAVPGMAVMFAFYLMSLVAYSILDERRWNTWPRLTATGARPLTLVVAKAIAPVAIVLCQQTLLFAVGVALFGLELPGSILALAAMAGALGCCVVSIGTALAVFATTPRQISVFGNICTLVMAGFGGALTPRSLLPDWARAIAPATPSYWAVTGFHRVLLDGAGLARVAPQVGVLVAFTVGFLAATAYRTTRPWKKGAM
jgi:ABC-2 type transport system permease protein